MFRCRKRGSLHRVSLIAWLLVGLGFFLMADGYWQERDPVLTVMLSAALGVHRPLRGGNGRWKTHVMHRPRWLKGRSRSQACPILRPIVPWLSRLAIVAVASQSALMLRFTGAVRCTLGNPSAHPRGRCSGKSGRERVVLELPFGEYPIQTDLIWADGTSVGVNIVLACTALQSMIVFVGAIAVLDMPWKRRARLLLTLPLIHVLNIFRNAGIVWLHAIHGSSMSLVSACSNSRTPTPLASSLCWPCRTGARDVQTAPSFTHTFTLDATHSTRLETEVVMTSVVRSSPLEWFVWQASSTAAADRSCLGLVQSVRGCCSQKMGLNQTPWRFLSHGCGFEEVWHALLVPELRPRVNRLCTTGSSAQHGQQQDNDQTEDGRRGSVVTMLSLTPATACIVAHAVAVGLRSRRGLREGVVVVGDTVTVEVDGS